MIVRHLACATMCPPLARWVVHPSGRLVCHCLLVETDRDGLVLVDTWFGLADVADPAGRVGPLRHLFGLRLDEAATAARQIEALFTTTARRLGLRTSFFSHDPGTTFARPPRAGRQLTLF